MALLLLKTKLRKESEFMSTKFSVTNGDLYMNGVATEMRVVNSSDIRIQASGTGSCKLVGKLTANGEYKVLATVRLKDFTICESIKDNEIYAADATGLHSVTLQDVTGFDRVWVTVLA